MQIIGIEKREGTFNDKPYTNYNVSVLVSQDEFGVHTKQLKIKAAIMNDILRNHKMTDVKQLLKFEYQNEYYDAYRNLADIR